MGKRLSAEVLLKAALDRPSVARLAGEIEGSGLACFVKIRVA
jgi:hypothetical protein